MNWNGKSLLGKLLDQCIDSALNQTYPNTEIIFADNGSADGSYLYVKGKYMDKVRALRFDRNHGFCLGNNLAVRHVSESAKYLLFMNPDAILSKDYVETLVRLLETDRRIGVAQGLEISPRGSRIGGFLGVHGYSVDIRPSGEQEDTLPVLIAYGAAMLVRKNLFEELGGFDPRFFVYFDEADLCIRARCRGYEVVGTVLSTYLHKFAGVTSQVPQTSWYFMSRNRLLMIFRYFHGPALLKALVLNFVTLLSSITYRSLTERFRIRLVLKILRYLVGHVRPELKRRRLYSDCWESYKSFIADSKSEFCKSSRRSYTCKSTLRHMHN